MEEKELPFEYRNVEEGVNSFDISSLSREVFGSASLAPGSGELIALKLALQSVDNITVVASGPVSMVARNVGIPFVVSGKPAAFAQGLSRALQDKARVVVFADRESAMQDLPSLVSMDENVIYVCYNNMIDFRQLAPAAGGYAATASVAFYNDYMAKLKKACSSRGFSFIEVLTPNPSWGYEPSNTIEIAKLATECLLWPVYEIVNGSLSITKHPDREERVEVFFNALKAKPPEGLQEEASRRWKQLQKS
ncbi:MAG: hypothetical protein HYT73_01995 [Candidatus Aenigmarchaeota archaeon]|nr:hypothetical protein [Candidatus Aenigmarchaeota archaeon]